MMRGSQTLRQELAAGYPELPGPAVAQALDRAVRAALVLRSGGKCAGRDPGRDPGTVHTALVATLARDRLDVLRERHAAARRSARGGLR